MNPIEEFQILTDASAVPFIESELLGGSGFGFFTGRFVDVARGYGITALSSRGALGGCHFPPTATASDLSVHGRRSQSYRPV